MGKKTLCVGLAVAAILAMSGCGGGSSTIRETLTSRVSGYSFNMNASFSVPMGETREYEGHSITCQRALGAACSVVVDANTDVVSSPNGRIAVRTPTLVLTPTPTPMSGCGVGDVLAAGQTCRYEGGGSRFTITVNQEGTQVCYGGSICTGTGLQISGLVVQQAPSGGYVIVALPSGVLPVAGAASLGRVDELSKHDPGRHDMNKRQERPTELVITGGNTAELLELVEEPLNLLTQLVLLRIVMNRPDSVRLRRDDGLNPLHCQELTNDIAVICLVHHHRPQPRQRWHPLPHRLESHRIIALSTSQHERHPGALVRAGRVQLGGQSTPRAAQSLGLLPTVFFDAPAAC